jgi:flagellar biosynthesis chaperone FliJ
VNRRNDNWKTPLALLALMLAAGPVSAQKIYSWTNDSGEIVYGNSPPPEAAEQLFDRRFPLETVEDEAAAKQAQEDRILLQTYLSVAEIEKVRDERLAKLQGQDRLTRSYVDNLNRQLADLEEALDNIDIGSDNLHEEDPTMLAAEIGETRRRIQIYETKLEQSASQQEEIRQKFADDIDRFQQLRAANDG